MCGQLILYPYAFLPLSHDSPLPRTTLSLHYPSLPPSLPICSWLAELEKNCLTLLYKNDFFAFGSVSHQWCDRLLHSYTRHIERVVRGGRDTFLSAQEWGHGDVAQGNCVSQATQAEWHYQGTWGMCLDNVTLPAPLIVHSHRPKSVIFRKSG